MGVEWGEILRGGIGGLGLSEDIRQTYHALASHYEAGDKVFLFGFSRGAYTARSLAGLISNLRHFCPAVRIMNEPGG